MGHVGNVHTKTPWPDVDAFVKAHPLTAVVRAKLDAIAARVLIPFRGRRARREYAWRMDENVSS